MRLFRASVLPLILAVCLSGSSALAQNVHFKGGKNATPRFSDLGTQLSTCVNLAGLGEGDITVTLQAAGDAFSQCTNPGGNVAPGQNKVPVVTEASATVPQDAFKNGTVRVCLTTAAPDDPTAAEAGCPNGNWTAAITDVVFESAIITVEQGGQIVLQQAFNL